ncbi:polysaccharide biosynthesis protein [Caballeronia terrestris]|uniref:Polysaccharide biosynthesis protein n=1 Tax=Caballeronia terrestris TaxID=1226301 RepID=A0A158IT33_9BURK|nr:flippase [Caballeronia terrestris]SAL59747.1 polysaccharide biosynthesis protein [Caballeronia terrestris]
MASFKKNFAVLMMLQVSTYAVPLITLPLLTRVLSPEGYGRLAFSMAFINYFIVLTNYGFGLTATPQISINRGNRAERSRVFWETFMAQTAITVAGFVLLMVLTFIFPRLGEDRDLLMLGFGMAVGAMLIPTWYFQGVEDLRVISSIVFTGRVLSVPAMYLLVRDRSDIYWAMGVNSLVPLLSGIAIVTYLYLRRELDFVHTSVRSIVKALKDGSSVFMATAITDFYASSNIVLLALISGNVAAGYFAAGDKLIRAALGMMSPLKTAAYPRISYLMHHSREDAFAFLRKMLAFQGTVVAIISLTIFLGAPLAVKILYGPQFLPTVEVLRWMAFVPFMSGIADVFGVQTMLPLGMKAHFSRVLLGSATLNFVLLAVLSKLFAEQGAAATVLAVQTCVAIAMATTLYMQGVPFLKRRVAE